MTNLSDSQLALEVLTRLLKEREIEGIRLGSFTQLLISSESLDTLGTSGQIYVGLINSWNVFGTRPIPVPNQLPFLNSDDEIDRIRPLLRQRIASIELGSDHPHFILTTDTGPVLVVNGSDDQYESWHVGVAYAPIEATCLVVACPGSGLAVWAPDELLADIERRSE